MEAATTATPTASPIFKGVTSSDITITSRNGQPVTPDPAETPSPAEQEPESTVESPAETPESPPETPETAPEETPESPTESSEEGEDFFEYAATNTGGVIRSPDDVFALYDEVTQLRTQLAERPAIEFPNDQARQLYEFCLKYPGQELATARNSLHVLSLDVSKLSDKEAQFEAFALKNSKLPRDEARRFFEAKYEKNYGNGILEEDVVAQYDHKVQTEEAKESLNKLQEEIMKAPPSKPAGEQPQAATQEVEEVRNNVRRVLEDFGGVKYQHFDNDPNSVVSVPFEDADHQRFERYVSDPNSFFTDILEQCQDKNGDFNYDTYVTTMYELVNMDKIREQSFNSGVKYGELKKIMEIKNTSTEKPTVETPPASTEPKTFKEAMRQALMAGKTKRVA